MMSLSESDPGPGLGPDRAGPPAGSGPVHVDSETAGAVTVSDICSPASHRDSLAARPAALGPPAADAAVTWHSDRDSNDHHDSSPRQPSLAVTAARACLIALQDSDISIQLEVHDDSDSS
jgi:hypothetical protein